MRLTAAVGYAKKQILERFRNAVKHPKRDLGSLGHVLSRFHFISPFQELTLVLLLIVKMEKEE